AGDEGGIGVEAEMRKSLAERDCANIAITPVRLPIMGDVARFPVFPERLDIDAAATGVAQNALERAIGAFAHGDERAEHIEGHEVGCQGGPDVLLRRIANSEWRMVSFSRLIYSLFATRHSPSSNPDGTRPTQSSRLGARDSRLRARRARRARARCWRRTARSPLSGFRSRSC